MESTIHITQEEIQHNSYYKENPCNFLELIETVKRHKNIKTVLLCKRKKTLRDWIISSTPLLNDPVYDILTRSYWIINDIKDWSDARVICPECKKPFIGKNIYRLRLGYSKRCSIDCMNKSQSHKDNVRRTFNEHATADPNFKNNIKERRHSTHLKNGHSATWTNPEQCKQTKQKNHGDPNYNNVLKARQTRFSKYDGQWHPIDQFEKSKQTCLKRHGYECALSNNGKRASFDIDAIRQKAHSTMRKNFTYNRSKQEEKAFELLCNEFKEENIERQHKTDEYPYYCDFFIRSLNVYLEYNGSWTHGRHAYDISSKADQALLKKWKSKSIANQHRKHNYYERAIYVWTVLDVKKRNTAKENNLNFVEVWTIDQLKKWISQHKQ